MIIPFLNIFETGSGALDMKWSHYGQPLLATAQSDGRLCLYEVTLGDSGKCSLKLIQETEITSDALCHGLEAWTACFPTEGSNDLFYSGGDDCKLNCYDLKVSETGAVRSNSRSHRSGVTSMVSIRQGE